VALAHTGGTSAEQTLEISNK